MPNLVNEYCFDKNVGLDFDKLTHGMRAKVWWNCSKGHEWKASINSRTNKQSGCPYCSNQKICEDNCLKNTNPELLKEWDYNKNKIKPTEIVAKSDKKVFWICSDCKNSWRATPRYLLMGHHCPYCNGKKVKKEDSLLAKFPSLIKEWDYNKNTIRPYRVHVFSNKKYYWICKKCDKSWKTSVIHRTKHSSGCPRCNESKGEKLVSQILGQLKIRNKREFKFSNLGNYRFDFALLKKYKRKPYAVIEYNGRQHYEVANFSKDNKKNINNFKKIQKNDKIKKQYCIDNNIKYLEIPYTKKNNIEQIIKEFLNKQGVKIDEKTKTI